MKKPILILAITTSIIAIALSLSAYFHYTFIPVIFSLVLGCIVFYLGRKHQYPKKSIQIIFLAAIIAISIALFKSINSPEPIVDEETLEINE